MISRESSESCPSRRKTAATRTVKQRRNSGGLRESRATVTAATRIPMTSGIGFSARSHLNVSSHSLQFAAIVNVGLWCSLESPAVFRCLAYERLFDVMRSSPMEVRCLPLQSSSHNRSTLFSFATIPITTLCRGSFTSITPTFRTAQSVQRGDILQLSTCRNPSYSMTSRRGSKGRHGQVTLGKQGAHNNNLARP